MFVLQNYVDLPVHLQFIILKYILFSVVEAGQGFRKYSAVSSVSNFPTNEWVLQPSDSTEINVTALHCVSIRQEFRQSVLSLAVA